MEMEEPLIPAFEGSRKTRGLMKRWSNHFIEIKELGNTTVIWRNYLETERI